MSDKKEGNGVALAPEAQKRLAIYDQMSAPLKKVADDFRKKETQTARGNIMVRYDMGVKIKEVMDNESEYGTNAVEQLAKFLNRDANDMYNLRNVVKQYEREEVQKLADREMTNGGHITMAHFFAIGKVGQAKNRNELWERVFNESLSFGQLATEVAAGYETTHKRSGGRPPSRPTSPQAAIQEVYSSTHGLNNRFDGWNEVLFDKYQDIPTDKVNENLLERLESAVSEFDTLEERLTQYKPKIEKVRDHVKKIVTKKQEEEAAAVAEQKEEERALDGKGKKDKKVKSGKKTKASKKTTKAKRPAAAH